MQNKSNFNKFLLLWFGELISSVGGGLTGFGLSVYIFNITGSAANMALVMLLSSLPILILGMPAGVLADKVSFITGNSIGRSSGIIISISGIMLLITGIMIYFIKPIKELEKNQSL